MITLRIQYAAQLRTVMGKSQEEVQLPEGHSLAQLLAQLAVQHPSARAHLVTDTGEIRPSLMLAINDLVVDKQSASTTLLRAGDTLTLLPPIAGG